MNFSPLLYLGKVFLCLLLFMLPLDNVSYQLVLPQDIFYDICQYSLDTEYIVEIKHAACSTGIQTQLYMYV